MSRNKTVYIVTAVSLAGLGALGCVAYSPYSGFPPLFSFLALAIAAFSLCYLCICLLVFRKRLTLIAQDKFSAETVLDNVIDSVIRIEQDGTISMFNASAERVFGYSKKEILGRKIKKLLADKKDLHDLLSYTHTPLLREENQLNALRKDGSSFPIDIGITELQQEDGQVFVLVLRDVTEKKKVETQIRIYTDQLEWAQFETEQARRQAEHANQAKSMFLANMSHEIRTPLNGVIGMTELLLNTELDAKQRRYATQIYASSDHLLKILNDILDFSKIEAGALRLEEIPFSLKTIATETVTIFLPLCSEKKLELNVHFDANLPHDTLGDPVRIRQVLNNLVSNAIKFTKEGKIDIHVKVLKALKRKATIRIEVTDSGIGISEEKILSVFDKFAQADISTTRKYGGTGLGLAICRQLIGMMDGKIGATSTLGQGSTFWFEIPLKRKNVKEKKSA